MAYLLLKAGVLASFQTYLHLQFIITSSPLGPDSFPNIVNLPFNARDLLYFYHECRYSVKETLMLVFSYIFITGLTSIHLRVSLCDIFIFF
jgi:hypothetical protein